ncbi:hypothetical protein EVA_06486 [gut metagenome]|uniref:Uncharacterized protein n=1 Tax=gut metagenome TaxID=749906 RepID=J9GES4_9ZZZZ
MVFYCIFCFSFNCQFIFIFTFANKRISPILRHFKEKKGSVSTHS